MALFRSHLMTVHAALRKVPGVELADDVEVRVKGHIDVYPPTGRLQLIMTGIDPVFTAGALAANRDRVLRQLEAEGLLRANAVHELPEVPLRIGLVTSAASAAYHDFIDERDLPPSWCGLDLTVEVEAKAKEVAVLELKRLLEARDCQ